MRRSRRAVLRGVGAAVGTGLVTGLAGCSSGSPESSDTGEVWYGRRLPTPELLEDDYLEFEYYRMADLLEDWDPVEMGLPQPFFLPSGVSPSDVTHYLWADGRGKLTVLAGDFHGRAMVELLRSSNTVSRADAAVEVETDHELYLLGEDDPEALAAADGIYMRLRSWGDARAIDRLARYLEILHGDRASYPETDTACRDLIDTVGQPDVVLGQRHQPYTYLADAVGESLGLSFGEETEVTAAFAFESAAAAIEQPVRQWADLEDAIVMGDWVTVETRDRIASLQTTIRPDPSEAWHISLPDPVDAFDRPYVAFDTRLERLEQPERGLLTVSHVGERLVPAAQVRLDGEGFADLEAADQTEAGPWQGEVSGSIGDTPAIESGDAVTVGVRSPYSIELTIEGERGQSDHFIDGGTV